MSNCESDVDEDCSVSEGNFSDGWVETDRRVLLLLFLLLATSLKDTSSFWVVQETSFWLKRAIMVTGSRGILKVFWESSSNCGKSLPIVALFDAEFSPILVVEQLPSPDFVHCEPVYPFVQTQEQIDPLDTLTPPFLHGFDFSHDDREFDSSCGTTMRKTGRRTASVMARSITTHIAMNSHRGNPQHLRGRLLCFSCSWSEWAAWASMLWNVDRLKKAGHDERPSLGGGGKDAKAPFKDPELRHPYMKLVY